ncbi:phosphopantetheine-binding protein [Micromonospora echinospora]|uniref:phosphopantetheine-binding protein n=1 Tax=Micromonospora echinospora TaxID=1877 RepID=UPI003430BC68
MTTAQWPEQFDAILRAHLPLLEATEPLLPDVALADLGLDSLATVTLLLELEDEFGVTIPDELLNENTFATPQQLWLVLTTLTESAPAS